MTKQQQDSEAEWKRRQEEWGEPFPPRDAKELRITAHLTRIEKKLDAILEGLKRSKEC